MVWERRKAEAGDAQQVAAQAHDSVSQSRKMQTAGNDAQQWGPLHLLALHTHGFSKFAANKGANRIGDIRQGQDVGLCDLSGGRQ